METSKRAVITSFDIFVSTLRSVVIERWDGEDQKWQMFYGFVPSDRLIIHTENPWDAWMEYLHNFELYDTFIPSDSFLRESNISPDQFQSFMIEMSKEFGTYDNAKSLPTYVTGIIEETGEVMQVILSAISNDNGSYSIIERVLSLASSVGEVSGFVKRQIREDSHQPLSSLIKHLQILESEVVLLREYIQDNPCYIKQCLSELPQDKLFGGEKIASLRKEYADLIAYVALDSGVHNIKLQSILNAGIAKMKGRKESNTLFGSGNAR